MNCSFTRLHKAIYREGCDVQTRKREGPSWGLQMRSFGGWGRTKTDKLSGKKLLEDLKFEDNDPLYLP